ncbi:Uncharacterised protein [Buttiauxella agrestis]|uniref:Lipopolysaccharide biosynthesis protein n=1 Tax=Buttiauxella agrestis TaxID=82977 RepID=A0A381C590_9ENTR|nr:hypothetical protein [Buttiauxella agrestis]SUW63094.1 Uncharacterised protein [Buttiauxella agrestis]
MINDSTALFICPDFFDYKKYITQELSSKYKKVISLSDRPACSSIAKALIKYNAPVYSSAIAAKYSQHIINLIENELPNISDVIIIKGTCITPSFIEQLRSKKNDINIVCYSWDSISNIKTFISLAEKADKSFTFDLKDSVDYKLNYLPLFYVDHAVCVDISDASDSTITNNIFDYTFIGSYHGDRIRVLSKFLSKKPNSKSFIKIYFQSYLQYLFYLATDSSLRSCSKEWITFKPLSRVELEAKVECSEAIIDIHHSGQTGLTMRTWETLHAGHRLITTNPVVLLHTTTKLATVIDRDSGTEWESDQCEKYRYELLKLVPHSVSYESLPLSDWIMALLMKS